MAELSETYACVPSTERGRGILVSGDPKSNAILYCNGRSVIIRYLHRPLDVSIYGDHAYPVTVARFSPNGEWIASADVSGTVKIWGTHNDHVLKNEFRVLSGRIDDLHWSPDMMRIVASGDGKGKSFVRAFMETIQLHINEGTVSVSTISLEVYNITVSTRYCTRLPGLSLHLLVGSCSISLPVKLKNMLYHTARINCLAWSLDNTMVATGSLDTCVIVYDISKPASSRITIKGAHLGGVAFTDNRSIVSSGEDACVRVWRLTSQ